MNTTLASIRAHADRILSGDFDQRGPDRFIGSPGVIRDLFGRQPTNPVSELKVFAMLDPDGSWREA